jgi:hypothetical protein
VHSKINTSTVKMADAGLVPIKRALVSVFDKASIEDLAKALKEVRRCPTARARTHTHTHTHTHTRPRKGPQGSVRPTTELHSTALLLHPRATLCSGFVFIGVVNEARAQHTCFFFVCDCCMCLAQSPAPTCHAYLDVPRSVGITHSAPTLPCSVYRSQFPAPLRVHVHSATLSATLTISCTAAHSRTRLCRWVLPSSPLVEPQRHSRHLVRAQQHPPAFHSLALGLHHYAQPAHESAPAMPVALVEREAERAHVLHEPPTHVLVTRTALPCAGDTNHSPMCL